MLSLRDFISLFIICSLGVVLFIVSSNLTIMATSMLEGDSKNNLINASKTINMVAIILFVIGIWMFLSKFLFALEYPTENYIVL